ncbi:uncharacterized protein BDZ99DRAFT_522764 [Mytilinidion resinicola]|uniref:Uncharacterized protein n=1 Tax=Mytilinidion resinicola TaxID=574789 RepID=A0A6A6YE82_9PEZI|nr:uncharacterized protein BDZ99DRAFT_522764 [Mytilinidion resinicola]KAF2807132.1 hypothetical protein BDZ99DRAFT_522764 [Mytilinidion resinicola]
MALGEQDTWMTVADGKAAWSGNISAVYPAFTSAWNNWNNNGIGYVTQIVLGTNGNYFIKGLHTTSSRLNQDIIDYVKPGNLHAVEVCALGRSGAYVMQLPGRKVWDLKGHYGSLHQNLERGGRIRIAALSLTHDHFVVVYEDGSAYIKAPEVQMASWKEWITKHFGSSW